MHFVAQASFVCKHHHVGGRLVTHPMFPPPRDEGVCALLRLSSFLPAPVDWVVKLPRSFMRSDSSFSSRGKEETFRGRREKGEGGGVRMGGGWGISCVLGSLCAVFLLVAARS